MKTPEYHCDINQISMLSSEVKEVQIFDRREKESAIDEFEFELELSIEFNLEHRIVRVLHGNKIMATKSKSVGGKFLIEYLYEVDNLEECIVGEGEDMQTEGYLAATLIGLSYSTSRGIIITKSANTVIEDAILPIINPWEFVPEFEELDTQ